jgi:phage repressor protein C with HTH and peptisase S24 domain/transcriptional regulator with XRE-family HTH domain
MGLKENLKELGALRQLLGVTAESAAFGQEVRLARTKRGMTLDMLSAATGMAKSYLSQIETGYAPPPRDEKVRKIAEALGLDGGVLVARAHFSQLPEEVKVRIGRLRQVFDSTEEVIRALLAAGVGAPPVGGKPDEAPEAAPAAGSEAGGAGGSASAGINLDGLHRSGLLHHLAEWGDRQAEDRPASIHRIPIINKVAAGYPQDFTDLEFPVGVADDYVAAPAELSDPNAFAVRVVGDSMEPRYREGDVVIFSPAASVKSGHDCFVRFAVTGGPTDGQSTFKRVFFDADDQVRLQPLNERYAPTFVKPSAIGGIFRAVARYERL